ncbi:MAG: hypothetical protein AB200_02855 [Parcubacteria bacterium C7867-005]|nr:MAG: hypothetical protein AB200_02855 [Parcubacteria bacterium C7867-005]
MARSLVLSVRAVAVLPARPINQVHPTIDDKADEEARAECRPHGIPIDKQDPLHLGPDETEGDDDTNSCHAEPLHEGLQQVGCGKGQFLIQDSTNEDGLILGLNSGRILGPILGEMDEWFKSTVY